MAKAERINSQINALEGEYLAVLERALTACAGGRWGLFGQNEHLIGGLGPPELAELSGLAVAINRLRLRLGDAPFALHEEFEAARGRTRPNDPGEPKLAQAWLERLARRAAE